MGLHLGCLPSGEATQVIQIDGSWNKKSKRAGASWFMASPDHRQHVYGVEIFLAKYALHAEIQMPLLSHNGSLTRVSLLSSS
ncbi:hypothetical protein BVRB_1g007580 [Beta vulgaris subsp. vulgaris]|nr:hypothetical protein BVRB_1g007580 [Beta vulgaris subsp. vulgaris]